MAERGARPNVPAWRRAALRTRAGLLHAADSRRSPRAHQPRCGPPRSSAAASRRVERETADAVTGLIKPRWEWKGHRPGQYLRVGFQRAAAVPSTLGLIRKLAGGDAGRWARMTQLGDPAATSRPQGGAALPGWYRAAATASWRRGDRRRGGGRPARAGLPVRWRRPLRVRSRVPEANGVGDIRECPGCSLFTLGTDAQAVVDVRSWGTDALSPRLACSSSLPRACSEFPRSADSRQSRLWPGHGPPLSHAPPRRAYVNARVVRAGAVS